MTIFAVLYSDVSKGELPIIISDVLVTSGSFVVQTGERYGKVYLPSVGGKFPHLTSQESIAGLIQKTYVISDAHSVVFAGGIREAKNFYEDMVSAKSYEEKVSVCEKYRGCLQFVNCFADVQTQSTFVVATDDCNYLEPGDYGLVIVGGSGESSIRDLLLQHQALPFCGEKELAPYARALCLVSAAIDLDEKLPAKTIEKKFGGYYEVSLFLDGKFLKLEGVQYSYWKIEVFDGRINWVPSKIYFHEYIAGVLVVRRVSFSSKEENFAIWQDCYGISGFESSMLPSEACNKALEHIPLPFIEVASVEIDGDVFRFVAMTQPLVSFRQEGGRWFPDINTKLLDAYAEEIYEKLQARHMES